jgi:hypothetical protein
MSAVTKRPRSVALQEEVGEHAQRGRRQEGDLRAEELQPGRGGGDIHQRIPLFSAAPEAGMAAMASRLL